MRARHVFSLAKPRAWVLSILVALLGVDATAQEPARPPEAACVSCVILQIPPSTVAALAELPPAALEGLTIVTEATDAATARLSVERIRAAGATPGLVVRAPGAPAPYAEMSSAAVLILTHVGVDDEAVFGVRTWVTALRAVAPAVRILIAAPAVPDRLAGYVDGHVEPGSVFATVTTDVLSETSLSSGAVPVLVRVTAAEPAVLAAFAARRAFATEVSAAAQLTVAEIVARHQAQRRRQEELVQRTIAHGVTSLMFEVPGFVAPVVITAGTTIYVQPGLTEMEQRDIRVNGARIAGGGAASPPQLPLIEPERVATPPLTITLDDTYRYWLTGRAQIDGAAVYVVGFEGRGASGHAWLDAATFALRRQETVQAGLHGAIVSSEQHEQFGPFRVEGTTVWLPIHTSVFQMYEGAGHRTPIHRVIETPAYDINPADFDARLQAAHASPHLMLRETPQGFRYLLRDPDAPGTARVVAPRAGERIRTAVVGLLIDPNITIPLPFAGVSYVDLNLFDTGAQLNAFFGGTYGQLSWSVPSVGGTRWQAHGRVFAIAARYNDRAFRSGVERYDENVTQRPAHVSAGVLRPLTSRLRLRLAYELDYTAFDRATTTGDTFVVPMDAVVHGMMAAVDAESGAWNARAWWNPATRHRWREWGYSSGGDAFYKEARTFQRYGVLVARTVALRRSVGSRVELGWMGGIDLDRFSRYSFNAFDNRLHGYPTSSLRYDRGGVLRSVTSRAARGFRVDGFADIAVVRDPDVGDALRGYPGVGAALETAGPLRTLWSVDWGYGFRARRTDGALGTHAVRITGYRTF